MKYIHFVYNRAKRSAVEATNPYHEASSKLLFTICVRLVDLKRCYINVVPITKFVVSPVLEKKSKKRHECYTEESNAGKLSTPPYYLECKSQSLSAYHIENA